MVMLQGFSHYFDSLCGLTARIMLFTPKCFISLALIPDLSLSFNASSFSAWQ